VGAGRVTKPTEEALLVLCRASWSDVSAESASTELWSPVAPTFTAPAFFVRGWKDVPFVRLAADGVLDATHATYSTLPPLPIRLDAAGVTFDFVEIHEKPVAGVKVDCALVFGSHRDGRRAGFYVVAQGTSKLLAFTVSPMALETLAAIESWDRRALLLRDP
jgi:hypothetical protein